MAVAGITKAVLLALDTSPSEAKYDAVYGGEPLLIRALVALSKAGDTIRTDNLSRGAP
jgi:hypothetical protein